MEDCEPAIPPSHWGSIQADRRIHPRIDCHQWSSTPVAALPRPPLVLEARAREWGSSHNDGSWQHGLSWMFGKDFDNNVAKYEAKRDLSCDGHKSHWAFGSIHQNFFVWSQYYKSNDLDLFPRSLDSATRIGEIFEAAFYFSQRSPALLHKFEHFNFVRDHAVKYHDSGED